MEKVIDFEEKKNEKTSLLEKGKSKAKTIGSAIVEHKDLAIPIITGGFMVAVTAMKLIGRNAETRKIDCSIYDRPNGHRVYAKRPLKGKELLVIDERHLQGEAYTSILDDMGLLK